MRLTFKLLAAMAVCLVAVLAFDAWRRVVRDRETFETDEAHDALLVARTLAYAAGAMWDRTTAADAQRLVQRSHASWVWQGETGSHQPRQKVTGGQLETIVPIPDTYRAAVVLRTPIGPAGGYVRRSAADATRLAVGLLLTMLAAMVLLGLRFVARPTRALVAKARRVAAGDLEGPLVLPQRDELGELASEMNAMCERLRIARDRVESEHAARIAALEQLRHADRLTTVGRLASGMAHELGTPLNVVAGRGAMLLEEDLSGDEARDSARIIVEQTRRMTAIIRQLLDFARRDQARHDAVALRDLAGSTVSMLTGLAGKAGVELQLLDGEPVSAPASEGALRQVLTNLVVNAIHATPPGGRVEVEVRRAGDEVRLRVTDTGAGIPDDVLPKIFEPFFTTKPVGEGTGLGLSVAHGIVADHGGRIEVDTRAGAGTTFTVVLPLAPAAR